MDANAIFDALIAASAATLRIEAIKEKKKRIADAKEKRCGHCEHWMKTSCKPEKKQGMFKSANSFACGDFEQNEWSKNFIKKLEKELEEYVNKAQ